MRVLHSEALRGIALHTELFDESVKAVNLHFFDLMNYLHHQFHICLSEIIKLEGVTATIDTIKTCSVFINVQVLLYCLPV